jgi:predicted metal-dependent HD superfamily phosphohydrolase
MSARTIVQRCWDDLVLLHDCAGLAAEAVLDELVRAYGQPHRHYHTLDHIAALLRLLEEHDRGIGDRDAVALAILFHDIVYDPVRHDNEEASAALAGERLTGLGFPRELVAKVARNVNATAHGQGALSPDDADLALLLDLDLSILAAAPAEYHAYARAVRREYAHVAEGLYRAGRRRVLQAFLDREQIYRTEQLRALWEARARANIADEMAELG